MKMHSWISSSAKYPIIVRAYRQLAFTLTLLKYQLAFPMLIHNVEFVDYIPTNTENIDVLLSGIQVVVLPMGVGKILYI